MSYTSYTKRHHRLLANDPYDYQLTAPSSYRTSPTRHRADDYFDLDALPYPQDRHYVPSAPYGDVTLDQVGDYVSRRLVPSILKNSDLPLQLVMNFGTLQLDSDTAFSESHTSNNAVVYNAPGGRVTIGPTRREETETYGKKVGICVGCYKCHLVGPAGYCWNCEVRARIAESDRHSIITTSEEERDRFDRLGMRYVKTPQWINAKREQRERTRDRLVDLEREFGEGWDREWERRTARSYYVRGEDAEGRKYETHARYGGNRW